MKKDDIAEWDEIGELRIGPADWPVGSIACGVHSDVRPICICGELDD